MGDGDGDDTTSFDRPNNDRHLVTSISGEPAWSTVDVER